MFLASGRFEIHATLVPRSFLFILPFWGHDAGHINVGHFVRPPARYS